MAPPRKHDSDKILDAARTLVLRDGPRAASVAAIAAASGAPVGTLYHRFGNRDGILTAAWLRALERFQRRVLPAPTEPDTLAAAAELELPQEPLPPEPPTSLRFQLALRRDGPQGFSPHPRV